MSYTSEVPFGDGWYTEIVEDEAMADALRRNLPFSFAVLEDEWSADLKTRTIHRAEVELVSEEYAQANLDAWNAGMKG